jgi:hypothetical protein
MFHRFPPHDQNSCRIVTKPRDDEESTSAQSAVQAKVPWRDDPTGRLTKSATAVRRGTEPKRWRAIGQSWPVGCIKDFTDHKTAWKFKEPLMGKCETISSILAPDSSLEPSSTDKSFPRSKSEGPRPFFNRGQATGGLCADLGAVTLRRLSCRGQNAKEVRWKRDQNMKDPGLYYVQGREFSWLNFYEGDFFPRLNPLFFVCVCRVWLKIGSTG